MGIIWTPAADPTAAEQVKAKYVGLHFVNVGDEVVLGTPGQIENYKRKRGRPRGSKNRAK